MLRRRVCRQGLRRRGGNPQLCVCEAPLSNNMSAKVTLFFREGVLSRARHALRVHISEQGDELKDMHWMPYSET